MMDVFCGKIFCNFYEYLLVIYCYICVLYICNIVVVSILLKGYIERKCVVCKLLNFCF